LDNTAICIKLLHNWEKERLDKIIKNDNPYKLKKSLKDMEEQEILETLETILKDPKRVPWISKDKKITPEMSFRKDLGMDSLDTYEFAFAIEERLGITIPDEKATEFDKLREYVDYIKNYQSE